ncbi:TPA: hypothetical protein I7184_00025 [Vibrio vulnificus]|nr:hypothetical protein [Vibrio vulnificus]HAT8522109.1 hypothetical protein [Vibrio vulnificus]HDY7645003.1 hypothetical protein [Vibrio vulnificus]
MISLKENKNNIDSNAMTFCQLSFGKGQGLQTLSYEIKIVKSELLEKLTPLYNDGVEDLKKDDQITGEFNPPYPRATNYPSLLEFIDIEGSYLYDYLYAYHKFDILGIVFDEDNVVASYVVDSLESIEQIDEKIIIKGTAIKR